MFRLVKMLGGVAVLRRIAAANLAADHAHAQVHPLIACLHAVFAGMRAGFLDLDLIEMSAFLRYVSPP
jgi:hypothetical protein